MYTQIFVFVDGLREVKTRLSLDIAEPATLSFTKAYTKPSVVTVDRPSGPKPMEINVIGTSSD